MKNKQFPGPLALRVLNSAKEHYATTTMSSRIVPDAGSGAIVTDVDGHDFIDFHCDAGVNNLGHRHSAILSAAANQMERIIFAENHNAPNHWAMTLAENLAAQGPVKKPAKVFFCNSGAEANEAARKLCEARRWQSGRPARKKAIYFSGGFAGRTKGVIAATSSKPSLQRDRFWDADEKMNSTYLPYPRIGEDWSRMKRELDSLNLEEYDRLLIEVPCQGEGGINPIDEEALEYIYARTQEAGIIFISDCVQTGMGRVGTLFGCDIFPWLKPDILTMGKALGGGFPVGAAIFRADLDWPGEGFHSNTFGGHPVICRVGLTVLDEVKRILDSGAARKIEEVLDTRLREFLKYEFVSDIRGVGVMWAVEFKNPKIRDLAVWRAEEIVLTHGLGVRLLGAGFKSVRIMPPLVISQGELLKGLDLLDEVFKTLA